MGWIHTIVKYIFDFIVLFGFLFPMNPEGAHGLTSRRLSLMLAIIVLLFKIPKVKTIIQSLSIKRLKDAIIYLLLCILIIIFHLVTSDGASNPNNEVFEIWYFAYFLLYCFVFPLYCIVEFDDIESFAKPYIGTFVVQFVAVLMAAVSTPIRMMFHTMFYYGDDRFDKSIEFGSRIIGIALNSSSGSITCCTCAILLAYMLLKGKIKFPIFSLFYGLVVITTLFIGRTGVIVEAIVFLYVLFLNRKNVVKNSVMIVLAAVVFSSVFLKVMSSADSGNAETLEAWMTAVLDEESRQNTFEGINRSIPVFSSEFIFGTGIMRGHTPGGAYVESDSGYVMMVTALGIFGALFYYLFFYNLYNQHRHLREEKTIKRFFTLIIICSFLIEYKEPFMLKYTMPFIIVTIAFYERYSFNMEMKMKLKNLDK